MFKIATAGLPSHSKGTLDAISRIKSLGLDAIEIEFVRGVYMNNGLARKAGELAKKLKVTLTIHGPYYVNLNSKKPEVVEASIKRVLDSAERAKLLGAFSVAFHPAYLQDTPNETVYKIVRAHIKDIMSKAPAGVRISPETTGKISQFGTWEELLRMHKDIGCGITFDFSHIWAREQGKVDFNSVLDRIKKEYKWWKDMHIHLSGIRYGPKGELNHQSFDDTKMPWKKVLSLLSEKGFGGVIVCENPNPSKGALRIKEFLSKL